MWLRGRKEFVKNVKSAVRGFVSVAAFLAAFPVLSCIDKSCLKNINQTNLTGNKRKVAEIGRNEPCFCGSGRKFKRCCGSSNSSSLENAPQQTDNQTETHSAQLKRENLGLPGLPKKLFRRAVYRDPSDPRNNTFLPGEYSVVFTLSRPGEELVPLGHIYDAEKIRGNSHLRFTPSSTFNPSSVREIELDFQTSYGVIHLREYLNDTGVLSAIQVFVQAKDPLDAEKIARRLVMPSISHCSVVGDIPLNIYQVDVIELRTMARMLRFINPLDEVVSHTDGLPLFDIKDDVRVFIAIYREALNSNSFLYQFLCFFKIIDGILTRRERAKAEAVSKREKPKERLPRESSGQIEWLKSIYALNFAWDELSLDSIFLPDLVGKKITDIVNNVLRPLRNAIGHAFLEADDMSLSIDDADHVDKVYNLLPLTKCIARRLLIAEFPDQFPS